MKENKFILILVVCAIALCRFWELFVFPNVGVDINTTVSVVEQNASNDTTRISETNADTQIGVIEEIAPIQEVSASDTENIDTIASAEKATQKNATAGKNFVGCESSFSSHRTTNRVNGETTRQYNAKNIIVCNCGFDGEMFNKTVIYEYSSEPQKVELDCNSKCGEICAQN